MRIAGYVRQPPGRGHSDSTFAQGERIRRWAADTGDDLVAVCQDHHAADPSDRPGFRALLDIVRAGDADAVVIATLEALSSDKVLQEIMLVDLRTAGVTVISTDEDDLEILRDGADDHARIVVRDIVHRVAEYREAFGLSGGEASVEPADRGLDDSADYTDVVVELIAPTG